MNDIPLDSARQADLIRAALAAGTLKVETGMFGRIYISGSFRAEDVILPRGLAKHAVTRYALAITRKQLECATTRLPARWESEPGPWIGPAFERGASFLPRDEIETMPAFLQIIPLLLITSDNVLAITSDDGSIFGFRRSDRGDDRLRDRWSILVGGHIEPEDVGLDHAFKTSLGPAEIGVGIAHCLERELREECGSELKEFIDGSIDLLKPIGMIRDDSDPVGRVHLGLVYHLRVTDRREFIDRCTRVPDPEFNEIRWGAPSTFDVPGLESWGRIVLADHFGLTLTEQAPK